MHLIEPQSVVQSAVDENYEELAKALVNIKFNSIYL
jgi:hypothetical protein